MNPAVPILLQPAVTLTNEAADVTAPRSATRNNPGEPQENQIVTRYSLLLITSVSAIFNVWASDPENFKISQISVLLVVGVYSLSIVILAEYRWLPRFLKKILIQTI